jgi:hypothetical protein
VVEWWQSLSIGHYSRLTHFSEICWLKSPPNVIFVDEIDTTLSLDFTDDFFAAIRYL